MATVPVCAEGLWQVRATGKGGGDWHISIVQERDAVIGPYPRLMTGTIHGRDVSAHYYGLPGRAIDVRFTLESNCRALHGTWHEPRTNRRGLLSGYRIYTI